MRFVLLATDEDKPFMSFLKGLFKSHSVFIVTNTPLTISEVTLEASKKSIDAIITTNELILRKLTGEASNLDDYAGSLFYRNDIPILILNPLKQLVTVPYGKFLFSRYLSKLLEPTNWFPQTEFTYELASPERMEVLFAEFSQAIFIAQDIETTKEQRKIEYSGHCGVWYREGKWVTHTIVFDFTDASQWEWQFMWMRKFNMLPAPKCFQNGKYDIAYYLRWNSPLNNWLLDTQHLFHAWYAELPKRLDFVTAFMVRDIQYWKHEADTDKPRYNAKDCWGTANSMLAMIRECPPWAWKNFIIEHSNNFPCLQCEMEGLLVDKEEQQKLQIKESGLLQEALAKVQVMVATPNFNPGSPLQVVTLFKILGSSDLKSSDKKAMEKAAKRHPLNKLIIDKIQIYRKSKKALSSYIDKIKEDYHFTARMLYSLNPHGTDTGRLASKSSAFWVGSNLQNQPSYAKAMYLADTGYHLAELDNSQSESRCVAYISGDEALIEAVEDHRDFHGVNASRFFGIPYEEIVKTEKRTVITFNEEGFPIGSAEAWVHKVLNKSIRDLSKRTNHGANYNMGAMVMLETMGADNVLKAKQLLNLPRSWSLKMVCQYLLDVYAKTYPQVKGIWYESVKTHIKQFHMLVGATGWTRYCFGNPDTNKQALNSYVAHPPQSLSVMIINQGFRRLFNTMQSHEFRLKGQIHDSILCQYLIGKEHLIFKAKSLLEQRVPITDCSGITREMLIPVDIKMGHERWSMLKTPLLVQGESEKRKEL